MFIHTSPITYLHINDESGVFGSFLFFTVDEPYQMAAGDVQSYAVREESVELLEAGRIFYDNDPAENEALQSVVNEVVATHGIDECLACDLIDGSESGWDEVNGWDAEADWQMQYFTARAAKACGYDGVAVEDEQGTSYMIDCMHRNLRNVTKWVH